jgi:hypothetical protein
VFKSGDIGWGLLKERKLCSQDAGGTPSDAQLRAKHGAEQACHGILFAYDYRSKTGKNQGKPA